MSSQMRTHIIRFANLRRRRSKLSLIFNILKINKLLFTKSIYKRQFDMTEKGFFLSLKCRIIVL
jgi:hypothetical protein